MLHLRIDEKTDQQQIFTCQVFSEAGSLLWKLEDVIFRKVLPEQIQKALAATKAKDAVSFFETKWKQLPEEALDSESGLLPSENSEGHWLFYAEAPLLEASFRGSPSPSPSVAQRWILGLR